MSKLNKVRAAALNQSGVVAQALILTLLLLGAVVGVYLVQNRTNLLPKAGGSRPLGPQNSFTLMGPKVCKSGWVCYLAGRPGLKEEFEVTLYAKSDLEEANLFTAKMTFPKDLVEVKEIKTEGSFIKNWVEEYYDNDTGEISLSGGVPNPGYKTQIGQESILMATIIFHAKALGKGEIAFTEDSAIYSNLNNINILTMTEGYDISVEIEPSPAPTSTPVCSDLALNKPVTSSGYWEDGKPERAVDGNLGTTWRTRESSGAWIRVDLGSVYNINQVKLIWFWDNRFGSSAKSKISVSNDGINWTGVAESVHTLQTNNRQMETLTFPSVAARHVRFYGTAWNGGWADMQTFEVYNTECQQVPAPTCKPRPTCLDTAPACRLPEPPEGWCPTPKPSSKGDGNKDGKINLIDMSVLHTDYRIDESVEKQIRAGIDMNSDGMINVADFSLLINLLRDLKVIRVR